MVGQCDAAVGVWNGNSPGTQKAIASAAEMGKHAFLWPGAQKDGVA
jgi:hypothetical protein